MPDGAGGSIGAHQGGPVRLAAGLVAVLVAMLVFGAPGALADTAVVGEQNLAPNAGNADQLGQNIPVFQGDAGGGYVLSSPRTGTITSWSFLSGGVATGRHFKLAVLAPTDSTGKNWRLVATSAPVAVSTATGTDAANGPFPVSIAIAVGQRIALMPTDRKLKRVATPFTKLLTSLVFPRGSRQPSTTARCESRVRCVGTITVSQIRTTAAARRRSRVLARRFFNIPPHRKRKGRVTLTRVGKRVLHRGARVRVRVTVVSVSPTGASRKHLYSQVLKR